MKKPPGSTLACPVIRLWQVSIIMKNPACILICCLFLICQACATPSEKFLNTAKQLHFNQQLQIGSVYQHRLILNSPATGLEAFEELHIYLDGDGTPWTTDDRKTEDPTSRSALILELMAKDPSAALLIGRPCYYGLNSSAFCRDSLWTSQRYSATVVDSMLAAIRQWLSTKKIQKLVLIGYSGGGTLAALLASQLENVSAMMTVAANLDVEAWCQYHGYKGLSASLNPAKDARIPVSVRQIHLAGLQDDNVPAGIIEAFSRSQANSHYVALPEYDHVCCWLDSWPTILKTQLGN